MLKSLDENLRRMAKHTAAIARLFHFVYSMRKKPDMRFISYEIMCNIFEIQFYQFASIVFPPIHQNIPLVLLKLAISKRKTSGRDVEKIGAVVCAHTCKQKKNKKIAKGLITNRCIKY